MHPVVEVRLRSREPVPDSKKFTEQKKNLTAKA